MEHRMTDTVTIRNFIYGGNATFTVRSQSSGKHWVFRINPNKENTIYFVRTEVDGESTYIGYILNGNFFRRKDFYGFLPQMQVIIHLMGYIKRGRLNSKFEFFHVGKCGACGRPLTDPTSIERGLGPVCAKGAY